MSAEVANSTKESRRSQAVKITVFVLLLAFYGSLIIHKINLPEGSDLGRHIKNGEMVLAGHFEVLSYNVYSYTAPDLPFINYHWLSGVIFYLVHHITGWSGLVLFNAVILLLAFTLLFRTALKKADFWAVALFSITTIFLLAGRTDVRPEAFSYLFIALYLYLLTDFAEHPEQKKIYWLIPLQILWVNLHILFVAGIMLIAGFFLEQVVLRWKNLRNDALIQKLLTTLPVLVLVSFVNPNGWKGAIQPFQISTDYGISISELQSVAEFFRQWPLWHDVAITIFAPTAAFLAVSFLFGFRKKPIFYFLATIGTIIAGFSIVRAIPLFGLVFLPAVSTNFNDLFCATRDRVRRLFPERVDLVGWFFAALLSGSLLTLVALGGTGKILTFRMPGIGLAPHVADAARFFKEYNFKGPIFNDWDIGSYLIYYLFPEEKVFVDQRAEAYSPPFFNETYSPMMQDEVVWGAVLQQYQFNALFLHQYNQGWYFRPFLDRRLRDSSWVLIYVDRYSIIFVRDTAENEAVIRQFQITPQNAEERLAHMVRSPDFEDQATAADIFNLLGRMDLGEETYLNVLARWPHKGRVWAALGEELQLVNNSRERSLLSVAYLEKAIALGWNTAEAYTFLGSGYIDIGQPENAREALEHALRINPDREDAKKILADLEKSQS